MASGQSFGNVFKKSQNGALLIGNASSKFRDGFDVFDDVKTWEVRSKTATDIVEIDGNANGSSYLKIVKDPRVQNSLVDIASRDSFKMPFRLGAGLTLSQRIVGQDFTFEHIGVDSSGVLGLVSAPTPLVASSISQTTTTLTINFAAAHGLVVGDRINITGCVDSRLNYQSALVATTPTSTQITVTATTYAALPSVTSSPAGSATIKKIGYAGLGLNVFGLLFENTTATNAIAYRTRGLASEQKTAATALTSNWSTATVASTPVAFNTAGSYAFNPSAVVDIRSTLELIQAGTIANNSTGVGVFPFAFTENVPDETLSYKVRLRAANHDGFSVPVGKIVSATKAGSTTATIVTDAPHGLTVNDFIVIYGNRDQTNFANLTTATQVASVIDANTFTIAYGASATATTYGGAVFRVNGNHVPSALAQVVQSVSATGGQLTVVGNTTWSGISIGEHVCLHGVRVDLTGADAGEDEIYKVFNVSTTNLVLVPARSGQTIPDLASTNCGGAVIKCTDYRLHFIRALDFTRNLVESEPSVNRQQTGYSLPVHVANTPAVTMTSTTVSGVQANNSATVPNPVLTSALGVSANPAAGTTGRQQQTIGTLIGVPIVKPYAIPEAEWIASQALTTTSDVALQTAAGAGLKRHITSFWAINTGASTVDLLIRDGTTTRLTYPLPVNVPVYVEFPTGVTLTANTALNAALSAAGTVRINATGYTAP